MEWIFDAPSLMTHFFKNLFGFLFVCLFCLFTKSEIMREVACKHTDK